MAAQPLGSIVAGLASLTIGAVVVSSAAKNGGEVDVEAAEAEVETTVRPEDNRLKELSELRRDCATGDGASCQQLGRAYETRKDLWGTQVKGEGVHRDDAKALHYFRLACNYDDGEGCLNLGRMYEKGKGVNKDDAEAKAAYEQACALIGGEACGLAGAPAMPTPPKLRS